jgi:hypothetical protein
MRVAVVKAKQTPDPIAGSLRHVARQDVEHVASAPETVQVILNADLLLSAVPENRNDNCECN